MLKDQFNASQAIWRCVDRSPRSLPPHGRDRWDEIFAPEQRTFMPCDNSEAIANFYYFKEKDSHAAKLQRGYRYMPGFGWVNPGRTQAEQWEYDSGGDTSDTITF